MSRLSISDVAREMRMKPSAIRYYEKLGLLPKAERISGKRRYDGTVLYRGRAGEVYNIVDDEPVAFAKIVRDLALQIGAPPPRTVPKWLMRLFASSGSVAGHKHASFQCEGKTRTAMGTKRPKLSSRYCRVPPHKPEPKMLTCQYAQDCRIV